MSYATLEGTKRLKNRFPNFAPDFFSETPFFHISSVGIGSYLGNPDEKTDKAYEDSVTEAVKLGCNLIDTAINYRYQRSERSIGKAIKNFSRDELVICTKAGFLPFDGTPPKSRLDIAAYFEKNLKDVASPEDILGGIHCMTPAYIKNQLETSLKNLDIETVDIFYLHNPEQQLEYIDQNEFYSKIETAFATLEELCKQGLIQVYGTATWNGYRIDPDEKGYMSLEIMVRTAKLVGGENHHFKFIQLPFNLALQEATINKNQNGMSILQMAQKLGINVIASASTMQGRCTFDLPPKLRKAISGPTTDAQRAIQFARSAPGMTAALVGMSKITHVRENLQLVTVPRMTLA